MLGTLPVHVGLPARGGAHVAFNHRLLVLGIQRATAPDLPLCAQGKSKAIYICMRTAKTETERSWVNSSG